MAWQLCMLIGTFPWIWMKSLTYLLLFIPDEWEWPTFYAVMTKNSHFAMQLSFTLNLNLTLVKNTYDMLNIIFKKCFLLSVGQEKLLNFVDLNQIFILVLILNILPNMHQIALQSIQISKIFRGGMPPDPPSKLRASPFAFKSHGKIYLGGN